MMKHLLYLFTLVFAACNDGGNASDSAFFTGKIVNPTSDLVFLFKDNEVIDSARLDKHNVFAFSINDLTEGLYHFNHGREYQYVYLEKGDSLQMRLNTIDFDESLVFSGSGSEINNFLIDLFLANEKEEKLMLSKYFKMEPAEFKNRINSLRAEKNEDLKQLKSEVKLSKTALEVLEVSIDYTYYNYKEKYPFEYRKKTGKKILNALPKNFYSYRNDIALNKKNLSHLTPYYDFIKSHLNNLSYSGCAAKCGVDNEKITNHLHFNRHKLNLIDSLVEETNLKDNLFRKVALDYLMMAKDTEANNEAFIKDFHLRSGNNKHIKEINEIYEGIRNMQPQKQIPNLEVTNAEGIQTSLQEIAKDKKVVFYFWTGGDKRYFRDASRRAAQLTNENSDYEFIGINYSTDHATWKGMIEMAALDKANQYKADNFEELKKTLIIYPLNKCIITDDAKIVDAFTTMWAANF